MEASLRFQRYHALDALRATMMLLGLVLHSAVSYTARPLGAAWPYHDQQTSPWFDLVAFFIHLFRMPMFFVVAGFFGALIFDREGARGMARNRLKRVLAPLALAWVVLYPLTAAGFVFALGQGAREDAPGWEYMTSGAFLRQANLIHLWFLYDLLMLYAAALVAVPLLQWTPATRIMMAWWCGMAVPPPHVCGVRPTGEGRGGFGEHTGVAHHDGAGGDIRVALASLRCSRV